MSPDPKDAFPEVAARGELAGESLVVLRELLQRSADFGFLGPGPAEAQLDHALRMGQVVADLVGDGTTLLDLGSGGGVPGLVIACQLPLVTVTLMESQGRRCDFLQEAADRLWDRLEITCLVEHGRAEVLSRRIDLDAAFQTVVARSFGPPAVVSECAARFLADEGYLFVAEPPVAESGRWSETGLQSLGMELLEVKTIPVPIAIVRRVGKLEMSVPRRDGVPRRKPLW